MNKILATTLALLLSSTAMANTCTIRQAGATSQSIYVEFVDNTTGLPNASRAYNDSGIDLEYVRMGAAAVDITEATQTAAGAYSSGGFVTVGHGRYRLDIPDAALAAGVPEVVVQGIITGYTLLPCVIALSPAVNTVAIGGTTQTAKDVGAAVPAAAAGASGGLLISGSNSGTTTLGALTVTGATTLTGNVSMAAGLNITQSSSNTAALVVTGNGTGNGATITSGSGATGTGLAVVSAATNGTAATFAGVGSGNGVTATGGATGHGISGVGGSTSGNGIRATGTAGNSAALNLVGQGSAAGLLATGGATGHGASLVGGATSGNGIATSSTAPSANSAELGFKAGTLSGTHSTTTADLGTLAPSNDITGHTLVVPSRDFSRVISSYNTGTGVATWDTATAVTLTNADAWYLFETAPGSSGSGLDAAGVRAAVGLASANLDTQLSTIDDYVDTEVAAIKTKTDFLPSATAGAAGGLFIAGTNAATTITTALTTTFTGNLTGSVASVTGAVGSVAAGGITASSIATDAIGAAELAADAVTEIQTGLATPTNITAGTITTATNLTNLPTIPANWLTAAGTAADFTTEITASVATSSALSALVTTVGVAGAGLTAADDAVMTRLGAPAGASMSADIAAMKADTAAILVDTGTTLDGAITTIDTVVDAIKAKTDQLTFGVTNTLNANIEYINAVQLVGDGSGTPFNVP